MEYNSQRKDLVLPEYGRHIQKMVDHALTLTDTEERNKAAQSIIVVMGQLNPHLRDVADFKHKLWDHLFLISDYNLDVESPYEKPTRLDPTKKPERLSYPNKDIKYRHYGHTIQLLIEKAIEMEEGDERDALTEATANLMKRSYLSWNRDSVNDETILEHLVKLSDGKLIFKDTMRLSQTSDILARNRKKKKPMKNNNNRRRRS